MAETGLLVWPLEEGLLSRMRMKFLLRKREKKGSLPGYVPCTDVPPVWTCRECIKSEVTVHVPAGRRAV